MTVQALSEFVVRDLRSMKVLTFLQEFRQETTPIINILQFNRKLILFNIMLVNGLL